MWVIQNFAPPINNMTSRKCDLHMVINETPHNKYIWWDCSLIDWLKDVTFCQILSVDH